MATPIPWPTPQQRREIGALARCDERTVAAVYRARGVRDTSYRRVAEAAAVIGAPPPPRPAPRDAPGRGDKHDAQGARPAQEGER